MRIIFVRHGHPNYEDDCLTPLGRLQAAAAAERVRNEKIDRIYSSTRGRAYQTAEYAANLLGLPITKVEYMQEISWCGDDAVFSRGQPWSCSTDILCKQGIKELAEDVWRSHEYFVSPLQESVQESVEGFDALLAEFGYIRSGDVYRCENPSHETIAIYSHAGSSSAVMSHLINMSFPHFCVTCGPDFTSVTVFNMVEYDGVAYPMIEIMNDHRHILGLTE